MLTIVATTESGAREAFVPIEGEWAHLGGGNADRALAGSRILTWDPPSGELLKLAWPRLGCILVRLKQSAAELFGGIASLGLVYGETLHVEIRFPRGTRLEPAMVTKFPTWDFVGLPEHIVLGVRFCTWPR